MQTDNERIVVIDDLKSGSLVSFDVQNEKLASSCEVLLFTDIQLSDVTSEQVILALHQSEIITHALDSKAKRLKSLFLPLCKLHYEESKKH